MSYEMIAMFLVGIGSLGLTLFRVLKSTWDAGRRVGKWEVVLEASKLGYIEMIDYDKNEYAWKTVVEASVTFPDGNCIPFKMLVAQKTADELEEIVPLHEEPRDETFSPN